MASTGNYRVLFLSRRVVEPVSDRRLRTDNNNFIICILDGWMDSLTMTYSPRGCSLINVVKPKRSTPLSAEPALQSMFLIPSHLILQSYPQDSQDELRTLLSKPS